MACNDSLAQAEYQLIRVVGRETVTTTRKRRNKRNRERGNESGAKSGERMVIERRRGPGYAVLDGR